MRCPHGLIVRGSAGTTKAMSMRHRLLCFALVLAAAAPAGCDGAYVTCTQEARRSVSLTVTDAETGEEVEAMVTVRIDGEPSSNIYDNGPGHYELGSEQEGMFEVTVSADGYESVTEVYEVTRDECHVETVEAEIELTPSA
jgi:hypothetical protein